MVHFTLFLVHLSVSICIASMSVSVILNGMRVCVVHLLQIRKWRYREV